MRSGYKTSENKHFMQSQIDQIAQSTRAINFSYHIFPFNRIGSQRKIVMKMKATLKSAWKSG